MNVVTRKAIDRRTLLRGSCCALALPALSAMTPALSREPAPPLRLVFVYVPNGVITEAWNVPIAGEQNRLSPTLSPLAEQRSELLLIRGLAQDKGRPNGDGPGDHARAAGSYLTATQPFKGDGTRLLCGVSIDQLVARTLGKSTPIPSLQLGAEGGRLGGQCDSGYPCAYSNTISWSSEHTPLPKVIDPARLYERLVGGSRGGESATARRERLRLRRSVLDLAAADARRLRASLGASDRVKLDDYLQAVRDVERRVQRLAREEPGRLERGARFLEGPKTHAERASMLFDLLALALETDTTRVATMMIANEGSNRSYPSIGVREGHHGLSHHRGDPKKIAALRKINRHHVELTAAFIARLAATDDGGRPLLENCAVVFGSGLSDGNRHRHEHLPVFIAGRLGGTITPGRHIALARETPMANLFVSLGRAVGLDLKHFGDSKGSLSLKA